MEESSVNGFEDLNTLSSAELFKELDEKSKIILSAIQDAKREIRLIVSKVRATQPPILHMKLKPRAAAKSWMTRNQLSEEPTLQEFLDRFLSLYSEQNRLNLSTLQISLAKQEAKLFHLSEGPADIFEILASLPNVFH
jgi:hypothetical protein